MLSIIILENDPAWKAFLASALKNTFKLIFCSDDKDIFFKLKSESCDAILLDSFLVPDKLSTLIQQIVSDYPYTPVIIASEMIHPEFVVKMIKEGAFDFIPKPYSSEKIRNSIQHAIENRSLKNERDYLRRKQDVIYNFDEIVSESQIMKEIITNLKKYSKTESLLLMTGETGTGKSFLAGTVHFNSRRKENPFISINCANIAETLLESELFGHEKGAFTSAEKLRIGRFEQAKGGTVFLDEIGELSLPLQAKLLRVLEEKRFERIGGTATIYADVRFIIATNRNLEYCIKQGTFRDDLYYRINVCTINLPPLRKRKECILPLSYYLLKKHSRSLKKQKENFSPEVLEYIASYSWPGNIRELSNTIERAIILEESPIIQKNNFLISEFQTDTCQDSLAVNEKSLIIRKLEEHLWIQKDAAKALGISPRNLNYKIKKFGIMHPRWRKHKDHH